jgi:hypothetical protein
VGGERERRERARGFPCVVCPRSRRKRSGGDDDEEEGLLERVRCVGERRGSA